MRRRLLFYEACFQHACQEAELLLEDRGASWGNCVFVSGFRESMDRRIKSMTERHGEPVNFHQIVRKTMPGRFSGFRFEPKRLSFFRPLDSAGEMFFRYQKENSGFGKMFHVQVGLALEGEEPIEFSDTVFRLLGQGFEKSSWVYHSAEELGMCLTESAQLLDAVLPLFENALRKYIAASAGKPPAWMKGERAFSAREALEEGYALAGVTEGEMSLQSIIASPRLGYFRQRLPRLIKAGRLLPAGMWKISAFRNKNPYQTLDILVPYEGPIRWGWRESYGWSPSIHNWIDSIEAADKVRELTQGREDPSSLQLGGFSPPRWSAAVPPATWLSVDAQTGRKLDARRL